jgi:hypothetical protein
LHQEVLGQNGRVQPMMHKNRVHCVSPVASAEDLAHMLCERTWCLCSGFYVQGHDYLFLNDSTCEDGAGEFSVILGGLGSERHIQIESITFSWTTFDHYGELSVM